MSRFTSISKHRAGEPRFGKTETTWDNSVKTIKLTPEQQERLKNGEPLDDVLTGEEVVKVEKPQKQVASEDMTWKNSSKKRWAKKEREVKMSENQYNGLTVEIYVSRKEQEMSDKDIMKEFKLDHNRMNKFKKENDLIGKFDLRKVNNPINKDEQKAAEENVMKTAPDVSSKQNEEKAEMQKVINEKVRKIATLEQDLSLEQKAYKVLEEENNALKDKLAALTAKNVNIEERYNDLLLKHENLERECEGLSSVKNLKEEIEKLNTLHELEKDNYEITWSKLEETQKEIITLKNENDRLKKDFREAINQNEQLIGDLLRVSKLVNPMQDLIHVMTGEAWQKQ